MQGIKPYISKTTLRVRYAETDQAGYVYYGNYPQYLEVGRVEAFRKLGIPYKLIEERGIIMPVVTMTIRYLKPAKYDDLITVRTIIREVPHTRIHFEYEVLNEDDLLLTRAETTLAFISSADHKPCRAPEWLAEAISRALAGKSS
jgi:acyl-CoA thioester hydrolase